MRLNKLYLYLLVFALTNFTVYGQNRKALEKERKQYQAEIKKLNKLLFSEQQKGKDVLGDLRDFQQKIALRDKLIATIQKESEVLSDEISANESKIQKLNEELKILKADYADMIYKSYKSKSQQSRLMFLLSSQNFYQAYKRVAYMRQYADYRKQQGENIIKQTQIVEDLNDSLLVRKVAKDTLKKSEERQKKAIEADKNKTQSLLSGIKKKQNRYKRQLRKKVQEEKKIAARIDKLIKAEIEKANRLAREKSTVNTKSAKKNEFILSPEAKALASQFESNKGKLPWPVKESIIVRRFGKQPHPSFPGITINGTGLHLVTSKGSDAEAIFKGEVLNILVNAEGIKNVMIRHGNYITSYNNLENVYVKKGDKISTGQPLGKIFTDKLTGKTKLVFVLFKNTTRLNPASWMMPRA